MYAIVEINGQQFKAEAGKKLFVQHIQDAEAQQSVEFERVLLVYAAAHIIFVQIRHLLVESTLLFA